MSELVGEVALITGGASGLGLAIALRFRDEGAMVAVLDRSAARLEALREEFDGDILTLEGDVANYEDNVVAVERVTAAYGKLSIFVGNAGIYDKRASIKEMDGELLSKAFDEIFGVNVKGYMLGAKAVSGELIKTNGCMIFTASVSSYFAERGGFLYVAAKHALIGLTRNLAVDMAPEVRVNAVAPGYINTNLAGLATLQQGVSKSGADPAPDSFLLGYEPRGEDYTSIYVLLASRTGGRAMTGTVVLADGGNSMRPLS